MPPVQEEQPAPWTSWRMTRWLASYAKKSVANGAAAALLAVAMSSPAAVARRTASVSKVYSIRDWPLGAVV
jgi:hypothetical protein